MDNLDTEQQSARLAIDNHSSRSHLSHKLASMSSLVSRETSAYEASVALASLTADGVPKDPPSNGSFEPLSQTPREGRGRLIGTRLSTTLRDPWAWEIISAVFGLVCFAVMVAVLASVDGKPIVSWTSSAVSPNAIISTLSTVGKGAVLLSIDEGLSQLKWVAVRGAVIRLNRLEIYDRASRGPLGSLQLLWSFRLKPVLAALGASLVVVAVAVDPFTQLLLQVNVRPVASNNDTALLPTSNAYEYYPLTDCEFSSPQNGCLSLSYCKINFHNPQVPHTVLELAQLTFIQLTIGTWSCMVQSYQLFTMSSPLSAQFALQGIVHGLL